MITHGENILSFRAEDVTLTELITGKANLSFFLSRIMCNLNFLKKILKEFLKTF